MIVTAKAGRPDTNRAGNEILRMIAEGKIPWRFLSQDVKASTIDSVNGVWVDIAVINLTGDHSEVEEVEDEELSEVESVTENQATTKPDATPSESEDSGSEKEALAPQAKSGGMFGALAIDEPSSASHSDEEDDE